MQTNVLLLLLFLFVGICCFVLSLYGLSSDMLRYRLCQKNYTIWF